jgi:hypothetical protein
MNKRVETCIIGGGISGIGCALTLKKAKKNFLLISPEIGGRICSSEDGIVNYGAYFVLNNYHNILPLVEKKERLHLFSVEFHRRKRSYSLFCSIKYPLQLFTLLHITWLFSKQLEQLKKRIERVGQKKALKENKYLLSLYEQTAYDFVKEKNIQPLVREFIEEGIYMCTFLPITKITAFDFLRICIALLIPAYEFVFKKEYCVTQLEDKIQREKVMAIKKRKNGYNAITKKHTFDCKNIVIATPPTVSKELLNIPKIKKGINAHMFHINGILKKKWHKAQYELFSSHYFTIFIRKQQDGSYILYSKKPKPMLKTFFHSPKIIKRIAWKPAFHITGSLLLDLKIDKDLYLAGDHNINGMEMAYLQGVAAANQIIAQR